MPKEKQLGRLIDFKNARSADIELTEKNFSQAIYHVLLENIFCLCLV